MAQNEYPDFAPVPPAMQGTALAQALRLAQQLGIAIRHDRILVASWIGRIYNADGATLSAATSMGYVRNESRFWSAFKRYWLADYNLLGEGKTVSKALAQAYRWPNTIVGAKLIHHHIDNGPMVAAIPETLHKRLSGAIHGKVTIQR